MWHPAKCRAVAMASPATVSFAALAVCLGMCAALLLQGAASGPARPNLVFQVVGLAANSQTHASAVDMPPTSVGSQHLRQGASGPLQSFSAMQLPLAGLLGMALTAAAVRSTRRSVRRWATGGGFNQTNIIPCGTTTNDMTEEAQTKWLEERCEGLQKLMPQTPEEFEDEVDELTWQWARHLLPFMDLHRHDIAAHKRRTVLKQRSFFEKMRLFKPLAMKYPTLLRRLNISGYPDIENRDMAINVPWIENEERIAGFTYEDFVAETSGNTFEEWNVFKEGDLISGVVVSMTQKGAFVEVGAKSWAYMPTENCSLAPIATPSEVLSIGQEIEAKIVKTGQESQIPGDPKASQLILSLTDLQRVSAWDFIEDVLNGKEDPVFQVLVKAMRPWGAVVQTDQGLEGMIPNSHLADREGDTTLVGTTIAVEILYTKPEMKGISNPLRPNDFALGFSYRNTATKALAADLEEGQVVSGTIVAIRPTSIDIEVQGVRCSMKKVDVSAVTRFELEDLFTIDEEIKAYVVSKEERTGNLRLSMRALEPRRGAMISNKADVFAKAEETAKKYFEISSVEKQKQMEALSKALETESLDETSGTGGSVDFESGFDEGGF